MLALSMQNPKMWMLDLEDFKALPIELRSALRRMLPDPKTIRQQWVHMTHDQKQHAINQIGGFIPQSRPAPPPRPQPSRLPTPQPMRSAPSLEDIKPAEPEPGTDIKPAEPEPDVVHPPLKKGFLDAVKKNQKKNTKNKKEDEVITLSPVGSNDVPVTQGGFLGGDD
jgi:hypothetical protein